MHHILVKLGYYKPSPKTINKTGSPELCLGWSSRMFVFLAKLAWFFKHNFYITLPQNAEKNDLVYEFVLKSVMLQPIGWVAIWRIPQKWIWVVNPGWIGRWSQKRRWSGFSALWGHVASFCGPFVAGQQEERLRLDGGADDHYLPRFGTCLPPKWHRIGTPHCMFTLYHTWFLCIAWLCSISDAWCQAR